MNGAQIAEANSGARAIAQKESLRDIVTAVDLAIDNVLRSGLEATGIPVISEEFTFSPMVLEMGRYWVIDPIDGTVNFAHRIPFFAVSAGLVDGEEFSIGVVCAPDLDELYFTLEPNKALINGQTMQHVHQDRENSLFAASFNAISTDAEYALLKALNNKTRGCLRMGSAALNLCWTAAGKLQCAYGFRVKLWDVAGGMAIAKAAGCAIEIRRYPGEPVIDYAVGSKDAVHLFVKQAAELGLWGTV
jgi:myo-inositol-1(or 4)-monophosphatase